MGEYHIKNFENFINGCNGILDRTQSDLIKWQPHYSKEQWENISFYSTGKMILTSKAWSENGTKIYEDAHISKSHLIHLIIVEKNKDVFAYVQKNTLKLFNRIEAFKKDNKMYSVNIAPKNNWFISLHRLVKEYKVWVEENITKPQTTKPPTRVRTTFKDIFIENIDYHTHLEVLCTMKKPLLKKDNNNYSLLCGKAAICRYFYHDLKNTALKPKVTQEDISSVLFNSIKGFGAKPNRNSYNNATFQYNDLKKHILHKN